MFLAHKSAYTKVDFHVLMERIGFLIDMIPLQSDENPHNHQIELERMADKLTQLGEILNNYNGLVDEIRFKEAEILATHYKCSIKDLENFKRLSRRLKKANHEESSFIHYSQELLNLGYKLGLSPGWPSTKLYEYLIHEGYIDINTDLGIFEKVVTLQSIKKDDRIVWTDRINKEKVNIRSLFLLLDTLLKIKPLIENSFNPLIRAHFVTPMGDFNKGSLKSGYSKFKRSSFTDREVRFEDDLHNILEGYLT